jgi:hypothetical protein
MRYGTHADICRLDRACYNDGDASGGRSFHSSPTIIGAIGYRDFAVMLIWFVHNIKGLEVISNCHKNVDHGTENPIYDVTNVEFAVNLHDDSAKK